MSQSSSPGSPNSIKSSEVHVGTKRSSPTPPSKPNARRHDTAKLPNFSIDEIYEEDGEANDRRRVDEPSSKSSGKWRCCKCKRGHELYTFEQGPHPVNVLSCSCTHRSCSKCTLEGLVRQFVPMNEPEVVPLSEDRTKAIRFGVFCDGCGLSWRAEVVRDQEKTKRLMKSAFQRIYAVPRHIKKRSPHPLERIRTSRSMNSLNSLALPRSDMPLTASKSALGLRALSNEMEKEHGEQAKLVSVRFTGIKCSCSMATDATSLCFQVVDPPKDFHTVQFAKQMAERNVAGFGSTLADKERGHGTPTLTVKNGVRHPNPLMSNPVQ